ncbi:MAG TPA: phosphatidate cytidylyltransferase [Candidatus Didemnitutus sp.]|nr:phosphatidate cytidylyltransferase [Candidatus Didemnitutus sp.]
MLSRILSTVLLWLVIIGSLWLFGAHAVVWLLTILAALTLHEFYALTEKMGHKPFRWVGLFFSVLMTAAPYYLTEYLFDGEEFGGFAPIVLAMAMVLFSVRILGERDNTNRVETLVSSMLGLLYVPFMLHYLLRVLLLFDDTSGMVACLWIVAVSKFCDVGALLTGMAIGKHKMAPNISPKKTWEGAVGGVLISCGVGAAFAYLAGEYLPEAMTPAVAAIAALPLALITIVSDLIESAMKRRADIKDTGKLIPGIGGAFDLTDSLILTSPVAYLIFLFLS